MPMIRREETVKLTHYKESGKYYSEEEFKVETVDNYIPTDELKKFIKIKYPFTQGYVVATVDENSDCFVNRLFTYDDIFNNDKY